MISVWIIILLSLLLSAFFSGMEIAFITSNRLKLELEKNKGLFYAKIMSRFSLIPSRYIGALLIGNNIALVIYGMQMTNILNPLFFEYLPDILNNEFFILLFQTIISTLIILFFAEFLPKTLFRIHSDFFLKIFAVPAAIFYYLFYPLILIYLFISEFFVKLFFRIKITQKKINFNYVDLNHYVQEYSQSIDKENDISHELQMVQNVIDFRKLKLRECMVPRTEIVAINVNENVEKLKQTFIDNGFSRILIFDENIDNIIGYSHSLDLFKQPNNIKDVVRKVDYVPETMLANDALSILIEKKQNIVVVVDEFGGTAGMVTMEDVIEEIFGEIEDEFDEEIMIEKQISEKEYIFSSRLEIDYLNEKFDLHLPKSEEYETLSGLLIHYQEDIPDVNEIITVEEFEFKILSGNDKMVETVSLKIKNN